MEKIEPSRRLMNKYLGLGLYASIGLLIYLLSYFTPLMADDYSFAYMYNTEGADILSPITSVWDIFVSQYYHYFVSNGRFPAQFLEQLFVGLLGRDFFNYLNALFFLLLLYLGAKLVASNKNNLFLSSTCILFCLYWFLFPVPGETLLWTSGSVCYLWTSVFVLIFLRLIDYLDGLVVSKYIYPLLFAIGLLTGWAHEGLTPGVSAAVCLYYCFNFRKFKNGIVPLVLGFWLGAVIVFVSPGIWQRAEMLTEVSFFYILTSRVRFIMYTKAFPILVLLLAILYFRKREICKDILTNNTILCGIVLFEFLFGCMIGLQSIRQVFFIELFSILLIGKIILPYCNEYLFKYRRLYLSVGLLAFSVSFYFALNACEENYYRYQKVFRDYKESKDGVIVSDFSRNPTWYATHNVNKFVHPYYFTHNSRYYLNTYLPYYIHNYPLIVLPQDVYRGLYCENNFCNDGNKNKTLSGDYYTTDKIDFYVKKIDMDDHTNFDTMNVLYTFDNTPLNDLPWALKIIRPFVKRLNPPEILENSAAITKLTTPFGKYLLIDKPYFVDMGVKVIDIKIESAI